METYHELRMKINHAKNEVVQQFITENAPAYFKKFPFVAKITSNWLEVGLFDSDGVSLTLVNYSDPRIAEMIDLDYEPTPDQLKNFQVIAHKRKMAMEDDFILMLDKIMDDGFDDIINPNPIKYVEITIHDILHKIPMEGQPPELENCYPIIMGIQYKDGTFVEDIIGYAFDLDMAIKMCESAPIQNYGWNPNTMEWMGVITRFVDHEAGTVSEPLHKVVWIGQSTN